MKTLPPIDILPANTFWKPDNLEEKSIFFGGINVLFFLISSWGLCSNISDNFLVDSFFFIPSFFGSWLSLFILILTFAIVFLVFSGILLFLKSFLSVSNISNKETFFFAGFSTSTALFCWFSCFIVVIFFSIIGSFFSNFDSFLSGFGSLFSSSSNKKFGIFFFSFGSSFFSGFGLSNPSNKEAGALLILLLLFWLILLFIVLFWLLLFIILALLFTFLFIFWSVCFSSLSKKNNPIFLVSVFGFGCSWKILFGWTTGLGIIIFGSLFWGCWNIFVGWTIGLGFIIFGSFLLIFILLLILFVFWLTFLFLILKSSSSSSSRKNAFFLLTVVLFILLLFIWLLLFTALVKSLFWKKLFVLLILLVLFKLLFVLNKSFILLLVLSGSAVSFFNLSSKFWLFSSIFSALLVVIFFENISSSSSSSSPNIKLIFVFAFSNLSLFSNSLWLINIVGLLFTTGVGLLFISLFSFKFNSLFNSWFWFSGFICGLTICWFCPWLNNFSIFFFLFWKSFKLSSLFSSSLFGILLFMFILFWSIWGCICGFILFCFIDNNKGLGAISILWFKGTLLFIFISFIGFSGSGWLNCKLLLFWYGAFIIILLFIIFCWDIFWLLFISFKFILLLGIILIPKPLFLPPGLPKSPVSSSSSSSSANIPLLKIELILNLPPGIDVCKFGFIAGLFKLSLFKLLAFGIILFVFGGFCCKEELLNNPPSPPISSTWAEAIAGFSNSFSSSLFSLLFSNIFWLNIGLPICCWTILWNSSGLLLFKLFIFSTLLLLFKLISLSWTPLSFGITTPCSFLISLSKFSSSSSSKTNPI